MSDDEPFSDEFRQIPDIQSEEQDDGSSSAQSIQEAKQISSGKSADQLRKEAAQAEHTRNEVFRDHFSRIITAALYVMALGILLFAVAWVWHVLAPPCWRWLPSPDIERIQNIVTGGVLAGLIADQFRKRMG